MIDCNNCINLNITEKEQTEKKEDHICLKYKKRVYHYTSNLKHEENICPHWNCCNDNYIYYKIR